MNYGLKPFRQTYYSPEQLDPARMAKRTGMSIESAREQCDRMARVRMSAASEMRRHNKERTMANHPNRGRDITSRNPTPEQVRKARERAGLTQVEAATRVHTTRRVWQQWEAGERRMHAAFFELFNIKADHPRLFPERANGNV